MPFLSEFLSENLSFSSVFILRYSIANSITSVFSIASTNANAKTSVNGTIDNIQYPSLAMLTNAIAKAV